MKINKKTFWKTFEEVLMENGEPFTIVHKVKDEERSFSNVNRQKASFSKSLDISFNNRDGFLRIGIYVKDKNTKLGKLILENKGNINEMLSFRPRWESGVRNTENTIRVVKKFQLNDYSSEIDLINDVLPIVMEFIKVVNKYGKNEFFDF